ncbi:MAG: exodeoxyribonuclease VII large subunit [Desulfobacteraceae bacterium]|jgi:exodeoxyribonuclease VII large subunit|nr:exodeoxyribonuclease VII large subunit [Desulfobacteraceae bacterium]
MDSETFSNDPSGTPQAAIPRTVLSVSQLTLKIKQLVDASFEFVWLTGEISNFKIPASGHAYFTLKDAEAQIAAVMFRGVRRTLRFEPRDGLGVIGLGRISVYPPRGAYQIILEYLEPAGAGALQQAFEALKAKLAAEGLFDAARKRPLPLLPRQIAVVTSATGAVFHDICHVALRRFPNLAIQLVPTAVQGAAAVVAIVNAIDLANRHAGADLIILARGGGSLEDLQAFNSEPVARAIAASALPVVSAVGHETDFTIADFVADLRAPTPSAAAEIVVPLKTELAGGIRHLTDLLHGRMRARLDLHRARVGEMTARLNVTRRRIDEARLRLDDLAARMARSLRQRAAYQRQRMQWLEARLATAHPRQQVARMRERLAAETDRLLSAHRLFIARRRQALDPLAARLAALSPLAVLARGYSITRRLPDHAVVSDASTVEAGANLEILLARGRLKARVRE